ncbi:uncharacterized protein MYCFIDRAFT_174892 [Pseudocercospora fijiensis CIRAD86]|uniref:C3H1-type domain-containing protein n=1 Tax=Pseudocercospora fijiensis (strain CIRAD86) TaxID=383855 RepID=M3B266_PSEFD|nr:uncharacterized protein MYCFIDRAFT_174892 [Pseudocercospora fijiensis CIRAD86]EME83463.1 hypothetical protein MYCFIDRAFT_174892 [Pseudocercospora fijiensis CIRAD86]
MIYHPDLTDVDLQSFVPHELVSLTSTRENETYSTRLMYSARNTRKEMSNTNTYTAMPGFLPGAGYQPSCFKPQQTAVNPRLTYFITRSNGMPVPLIPADELPFNVKLQNVARVLSPQDTYGLQYVGCAPYSGTTFQLERDAAPGMHRSSSQPPGDNMHTRTQSGSHVKQYLAAEALNRQALPHCSGFTTSTLPKRPVSAADASKSWRRSDAVTPPPATTSDTSTTDTTQAVIDAILRSEAGAETAERLNYRPKDTTPPPSGRIPDQEKKEYCTYWILHGDCAYVQQGCRYKHEMPDKAKLSEIGINHVPRWWLEKNAAVKFGEKAIVGEKKPISEWFKIRKDSTSDGDESESGSEDTPSEASEEQKKPIPVGLKKTAKPIVGSKQILTKSDTTARSKSPAVPPTRPSTPTTNDNARKTSTANSDLIDFATTIPTPSTSTASTARSAPAANKPTTPERTTKVFVPAGESPEAQIADIKKRARGKQSRTPSPSHVGIGKFANGLMASRHAPKPEKEKEKEASPKRQILRATCRPRRAVASKDRFLRLGIDTGI